MSTGQTAFNTATKMFQNIVLILVLMLPCLISAASVAVHSVPHDDHDYHPRLCVIRKWPDFQGYGFHLHAEKGKAGHFIGGVEEGSPSEAAHMKTGDKIIEVNGENVQEATHQVTVEKIKTNPNQVTMLVVDSDADRYFMNANIQVHSGMACVENYETPSRAGELRGHPGQHIGMG